MTHDAPPGGDDALARHRAAIDALDREILERLSERARHALAIGALKGGGGAYRPERETQVLSALHARNAGPLPNAAVTGVFREIMSACRALEQTMRVGYLGPAGTFSHAAVAKHFGTRRRGGRRVRTFDEVFRAAESGHDGVRRWCRWRTRPEGAVGRSLDLHRARPPCARVRRGLGCRVQSEPAVERAADFDGRRAPRVRARAGARAVRGLARPQPSRRACGRIACREQRGRRRGLRAAEPSARRASRARARRRDLRARRRVAPRHRGRAAEPHDALLGALGRLAGSRSVGPRRDVARCCRCPDRRRRGVRAAGAAGAARRVDDALRVAAGAHRGCGSTCSSSTLVGHRDDAPVAAALAEVLRAHAGPVPQGGGVVPSRRLDRASRAAARVAFNPPYPGSARRLPSPRSYVRRPRALPVPGKPIAERRAGTAGSTGASRS